MKSISEKCNALYLTIIVFVVKWAKKVERISNILEKRLSYNAAPSVSLYYSNYILKIKHSTHFITSWNNCSVQISP